MDEFIYFGLYSWEWNRKRFDQGYEKKYPSQLPKEKRIFIVSSPVPAFRISVTYGIGKMDLQ